MYSTCFYKTLVMLYSSIQLEINIIDENDNAPQFKVPTYSKTLVEDAAIGTTVIIGI